MPFSFSIEVGKALLGSIGLLATLAVAYGVGMRLAPRAWQGRVLLGAVFGGACLLTMLDNVSLPHGPSLDLRNLPIALAGAFLGAEGLAVALLFAAAACLGFGGEGSAAGIASLVLAGLLGLLWARRPEAGRGVLALPRLVGLVSLHWVTLLVLPAPAGWGGLPTLLAFEGLGLLVVGGFLERERRQLEGERRLEGYAERDALTGLLNRRGFEKALARLPAEEGGALLLLDLDHFKRVNDRLGHPAGDAVLRALGARLSPALGGGHILARLGGEEIAVFLPGRDVRAGEDAARHLRDVVRDRPFRLPDGQEVAVTVSIGGARGLPGRLERLMARADGALYAAKRAGRDRVRFAGLTARSHVPVHPGFAEDAPAAPFLHEGAEPAWLAK